MKVMPFSGSLLLDPKTKHESGILWKKKAISLSEYKFKKIYLEGVLFSHRVVIWLFQPINGNECPEYPECPASILSRNGAQLKEVDDFKYLGSVVADSKKDFLTRKAQAWKACNKLHIIWQSNISRKTKLDFFRACVQSILLYGSETWAVKKDLQDRLDGIYTRLLMRAQNISWREHKTKEEIYDGIPKYRPSLLNAEPDLQATAIGPKT